MRYFGNSTLFIGLLTDFLEFQQQVILVLFISNCIGIYALTFSDNGCYSTEFIYLGLFLARVNCPDDDFLNQ